MSRTPKTSVFLQRASYRQRRLRDAARLVPCLGLILWMLPLAWPVASASQEDAVRSAGLMYIFGVWLLLILLSAGLSRWMRVIPHDPPPETRKQP